MQDTTILLEKILEPGAKKDKDVEKQAWEKYMR